MNRDEIVNQRKQQEGPGKQPGSRDATLERQRQAKNSGEAGKGKVSDPNRLDIPGIPGRMRNADPEKIAR